MYKSFPTSTTQGLNRSFLLVSYGTVMFNASTSFSSRLLLDRLGTLTFLSMSSPPELNSHSMRTGRRLLGRFGASGTVWNILEIHCERVPLSGRLELT
jgi:hypothetical protein